MIPEGFNFPSTTSRLPPSSLRFLRQSGTRVLIVGNKKFYNGQTMTISWFRPEIWENERHLKNYVLCPASGYSAREQGKLFLFHADETLYDPDGMRPIRCDLAGLWKSGVSARFPTIHTENSLPFNY